jgi:PilZ domain
LRENGPADQGFLRRPSPRKLLANPVPLQVLMHSMSQGLKMSSRPGTVPAWKQDERSAVRLDVRTKAHLREPGAMKFDVDVRDLSVTGCRFETSANLAPNSFIYISVAGISPLEATIAWRDGFRYGCEFQRPLHNAVLDHIVKQHGKI